jgi:hypothetical protein
MRYQTKSKSPLLRPLFVATYRSEAKTSSLLWPRTPTVLARLAAVYNANAEHEDHNADKGSVTKGRCFSRCVYNSRSLMKTC